MSHSSLHFIQNINFLKAWNKPTCISGVPSGLSHSLLMQYYPHQHWSYTVSLFTYKVSFSSYLKRYSFIDLRLVSSYLFYFTLSWAICVILLHHKFSLFFLIFNFFHYHLPPLYPSTPQPLQAPDCCPTSLQNICKGRKLFSLLIILHRDFQTNATIFMGTLCVHGISQAFCLVYGYIFFIKLLCVLYWIISV